MELSVESVGDDLGGCEGGVGLRLPVRLSGPVPLTHHKPKLGSPRLPLALLHVSPPHPLLSLAEGAVILATVELKPLLDAGVGRHLSL